MSYDVGSYYFYQLKGRHLNLYMMTDKYSASLNRPDQLGKFGNEGYGVQYPNEDITGGLRIEYTKIPDDLFVAEDPETTALASLTTETTVDENSYLNLSRMQCLAVIDYLKSQLESDPNLKAMHKRTFWKKVSDHESNMVKINVAKTNSAFNLR